MQPVQPGSPTQLNLASPQLTEIPSFQFLNIFQGAKLLETDQVGFVDQGSISAINVGDCIAVFGVERESGKIKEISAYHIQVGTEEEEMLDEYFDDFAKDSGVRFYIVGGNASSTAPGGLLDTIHTTIENYFGDLSSIELEETNISGNADYISVNLQMDGQLMYCLHN